MKIVIATGIYPPEVGGPAYYAKSLSTALERSGHNTIVVTYGWIKRLPTGVRHIVYFFHLLKKSFGSDAMIVLDTFSVGLPSVLVSKVTNVPVVIRTGGDFLWEFFVERTEETILLSDFYKTPRKFTFRERTVFKITGFVLRNAERVVFSTQYQKDIFVKAYRLNTVKVSIIENSYGPKEEYEKPEEKTFICFTRQLKWKNLSTLKEAFSLAKERCSDIKLETGMFPREVLLERIKRSYAIVLVSLGDISPNLILEAMQYNKPFILTNETGLMHRLKDIGIFVDPLDKKAIADAICMLSKEDNYKTQVEKIRGFNFLHTYDDIAKEFVELIKTL